MQDALIDLERPLHYRREDEIDQAKMWRCLCTGFSRFEGYKYRESWSRERVPLPRSHGEKRIGEWSSIFPI